MNKLLLAIAMFFNIAMHAQENITCIWYDDTDVGEYYIVILNNDREGYQFLNFSFAEQDVVSEKVVNVTPDKVVTQVNNPDNGWELKCVYYFVDENTLKVVYTGDHEGVDYLKRKQII